MDKPARLADRLEVIASWAEDADDKAACRDAARLLRSQAAEIERLRAARVVPDGWALVPTRPTQAMCQEGQRKAREWPQFPLRIAPIYQAMLAAAPTPPQDSAEGGR